MKKPSKHFTKKEIRCKCGCGQCIEDRELLDKMDLLREQCGFPIIPTSWNRCVKHNKEVGGSLKSAHITGKGVDVECNESSTRFIIVKNAFFVGFNRIGLYKDKNIIHLDTDESEDTPQDVLWVY